MALAATSSGLVKFNLEKQRVNFFFILTSAIKVDQDAPYTKWFLRTVQEANFYPLGWSKVEMNQHFLQATALTIVELYRVTAETNEQHPRDYNYVSDGL